MDPASIGHLIAQRRRARGLTLSQLAALARVGRSIPAALESGKHAELGLTRVARLCAAVDLALEARSLELDTRLIPRRHLTDFAGRKLTKSAIDDVITRGEIHAWHGLVCAMRADGAGRIARCLRDAAIELGKHDPKARASVVLIPGLPRDSHSTDFSNG